MAEGKADMVALGRALPRRPALGLACGAALGADVARPKQYRRADPKTWPGARATGTRWIHSSSLAVLFAALCHAGWNAAVKRGLDPLATTILISIGAGVIARWRYRSPAGRRWPPGRGSSPRC